MCNIDVAKLQWTEGKTYSDTFRILSTSKSLKVSYYNQKILEEVFKKRTDEQTALETLETDQVRIENKMAMITDALIQQGFQPHYIQYKENEDCKDVLTSIAPALPPARRTGLINAKKKDLQKRYNNVKVFPHMKTMTEFMKEDKPDMYQTRDLIFQVLYGIGILQYYIKDFKHGNLTTDTVMVETKKADPKKTLKYPWPGTMYDFDRRDGKVRARIAGFEYASGSQVFVKDLGHVVLLKNSKANLQSKEGDIWNFLKSFLFKNFDSPEANKFMELQLDKHRKNKYKDSVEAQNAMWLILAAEWYFFR